MRFLFVFVLIISIFHIHETQSSLNLHSKNYSISKTQSFKDKVDISFVKLLSENSDEQNENGQDENEQEEVENKIEIDSEFLINKLHISLGRTLLQLNKSLPFLLQINNIYLKNISPPPDRNSIS